MEKPAIKRKQLRRKYKRRAAAFALGAAIMTGALAGTPFTKAQAAEAPSNTLKTHQVTNERSGPPGRDWHQHKYSWPSSDENQAWYQDGKIYYRSDSPSSRYTYRFYAPVEYVKDHAGTYGFNATLDDFTLLTITSRNALVEVRQHDTGKLYNVLLTRTADHGWIIADVRAI